MKELGTSRLILAPPKLMIDFTDKTLDFEQIHDNIARDLLSINLDRGRYPALGDPLPWAILFF